MKLVPPLMVADSGVLRFWAVVAEVFQAHGCKVRCARCVCEMREMIDQSREVLRYAAE